MPEKRNNGSQPADRADAAQTANPAEVARRELIAWCEQHQLPVPAERPAQPSGR
jgi:hypothetical protein